MTPEAGSFPLSGVGALPHVSVAYDGERWSDRVASGQIVPGEPVIPAGSADPRGKMFLKKAGSGDSASLNQLGIALRPIDVPDPNIGPGSKGPNEIRNTPIEDGEYVLEYLSGAFNLTLCDPRRTYVPGQAIGWDADGQRPAGVAGEGSWAPNAQADIDNVFEVLEVRKVGSGGEVILGVRFIGRTTH